MPSACAPRRRSPAPRLPALAAALVVLAAPAAVAQAAPPSHERVRGGLHDASDPAGLVRLMAEQGYLATLGAEAGGDPMIRGRISSSDYVVQFYECDGGRFCNSVQFRIDAAAPAGLDLAAVNAFNARWRYARASLAGATLRLQFDLNLDWGVTADNFADTLDIWRQLVEIFERELLARASAPAARTTTGPAAGP
jgi:hypothetical protein